MPKNNILYKIPFFGERLRHFMRRNRYKITPQQIADDIVTGFEALK